MAEYSVNLTDSPVVCTKSSKMSSNGKQSFKLTGFVRQNDRKCYKLTEL